MNIFGFEIGRKIDKDEKKSEPLKSFASPIENDGSTIINSGLTSGHYGYVLNVDDINVNSENDLILKYRAAAAQPECDLAISDIVNAAIVGDSDSSPVSIILDELDQPESVKKRIREEFDTILKMLSFNFNGHDIFRRWYVDGRLYYHMMVDTANIKEGIKELRLVDPLKIKKVKEIKNKTDKDTLVKYKYVANEYYLYSDDSLSGSSAMKIDINSVCYVPSGLLDETGRIAISHLHKSVKLVNQLRIMEDSLVIYRISRAPERRIFYIDIGNLPKGKAEEYVQGIMSKYRNKLIYDASTGEVKDDRKSMNIMEDFWLPRREGGRGTEITTLPGGENLGQIEDILFFQKKLYRSLNVPSSRLEADSIFNVGRASEISREEVKFQKFVNRLRRKFSLLFIDILRVQCLLKNVCNESEWAIFKENMSVDFIEDNFFSELKDFEILKERLTTLEQIQPHIGKYYSDKWVRSNVLNQTEEDIERIDAENKENPPETPDVSDDDINDIKI